MKRVNIEITPCSYDLFNSLLVLCSLSSDGKVTITDDKGNRFEIQKIPTYQE